MTARESIDAYLSALCRADIEAIVGIYAENATIEDPVGSPPIQGHDAIRAFYSAALGSIASAKLTGEVREAGNETAFPFELQMTYNGTAMVMNIIDTFRFDDNGKVCAMRAFWSEANMRPA